MSERGIDYLNGDRRRKYDIAISSTALAAAAIPAGAIALKNAQDYGWRNIFYRQHRAWGGESGFELTKFRTLPVNSDVGGYAIQDERSSRFANFLRRTGGDEIPQLASVLLGDMTVFGIRVTLQDELDARQEVDKPLFEDWHAAYQAIRPALTSPGALWWHASDLGEMERPEYLVEVMRRDLDYIENASLGEDLKLMASAPLYIGRAAMQFMQSSEAGSTQ